MIYKYFFFDFDGMLCDSYTHTTKAFVKALQELRNERIDEKKAYDLLKISFAEAYQYFKVNENEDKLFSSYHYDLSFQPEATLYLPVKKLLKSILDSGGKNFIYTNRNETLFQYLDKFGIKDYFTDFIINANKPEPKVLLDMIEKYRLDKKQCVVVGDRFLDVEGAYKASIDGILYDVDSRVFFHHATHVIKKINELYEFIDRPYQLKNNYHTHTSRCGHAIGEDEEYVIEAIKAGYQTLGFSDHVILPDIQRNNEYFESISLLKEKYKDQIDIKIALEVEYYPYYMSYYEKLKKENKIDYLIFGNHGTMDKNSKQRSKQISFVEPFDNIDYLNLYYECLKKAVKSKLFQYIAHPDVFMKGYGKWDENAIELTHKIAKLLQDNQLYAELSGSGYRSKKRVHYQGEWLPSYPFKEFFKILSQYQIEFILGCDAHAPYELDDEAVAYITKMAKDLNLNVVYEMKKI